MKKFSKMTDKQLKELSKKLWWPYCKAEEAYRAVENEINDRRIKKELAEIPLTALPFIKIANKLGWTADYLRLSATGSHSINEPDKNNSIQVWADEFFPKENNLKSKLDVLSPLKSTHKIVFSIPCDPQYLRAYILPMDYELT